MHNWSFGIPLAFSQALRFIEPVFKFQISSLLPPKSKLFQFHDSQTNLYLFSYLILN